MMRVMFNTKVENYISSLIYFEKQDCRYSDPKTRNGQKFLKICLKIRPKKAKEFFVEKIRPKELSNQ